MAFGKGLITLPTITGSHSDMPVLLTEGSFATAAIDGGALSLANGGGSLRFYTDDTKAIRLSCHRKKFVVGASPDIEVRVKVPSAFTGATIYVEEDAVETSQPADAAAYGRNDTYSNGDRRYSYQTIMGDQPDLTGNLDSTIIGTSTTTAAIAGYGDGSINLGSETGHYTIGDYSNNPVAGASKMLCSMWTDTDAAQAGGSAGLSSQYISTSDMSYLLWVKSSGIVSFRVKNSSGTFVTADSTTNVVGGVHHIVGIYDGSNVGVLVDGVLEGSVSLSGAISTPTSGAHEIARYLFDTLRYNGKLQEYSLSTSVNITVDYAKTSHANELNPDTWATMGAWTEQGGAGLTLTAGNGAFTTSFQSAALTYTQVNSYTITADSGTFNTTLTNADLLFNRVLSTDNGNYSTIGSSVGLLFNRVIIADSASYTTIFQDATLNYTTAGQYNLVADNGSFTTLGNDVSFIYDRVMQADSGGYSTVGTELNLLYGRAVQAVSGDYSTTGQDISFLYNRVIIALSGDFITTGYSASLLYSGQQNQVIGSVTAGFKQDAYTASYKPNSITVNFKD